ncbi:uncharacterized protein LOC113317259 [Papaver somniferum]|uniref:uncharacterized protein LOC113317259 n=1 Tax=Papaver somniferum TaxID=3469 RepID=UPI000E6FF381|nr:uncharacterized protein LOC113317259 [Papaver somniferum]XP_026421187.1 uncharacterized protein LOC113317259 [Papaver somniferum]XP_026421188.1 uncharacterized protein LOC113317259 [Papaver somniferum]XP_026421190.1 uncharacterized protein LOC113317259 [Papaver somniferum]
MNDDCGGDMVVWLLQFQSEVLRELSLMRRLVVATGGGAVIRPINWKYMKHGITVWLDVPLEALATRIAGVVLILALFCIMSRAMLTQRLWHGSQHFQRKEVMLTLMLMLGYPLNLTNSEDNQVILPTMRVCILKNLWCNGSTSDCEAENACSIHARFTHLRLFYCSLCGANYYNV